ncbi:TIGR00282 family metallophosphoesterase [bacterium]|nr:TIGR00282 family metallophosphoesterase [bacterium]
MRILFVGDLVGAPGRVMLERWLPKLREEYQPDGIIVNGENVATNGRGISRRRAQALLAMGVDFITTGNHIWDQRETAAYIFEEERLLRPANFPSSCPGKSVGFLTCGESTVAIINLQGRTLMRDSLECPFRSMETILTYVKTRTNIIFLDFHAEATSEKSAMGSFLDGQVSGIVGTHTHVQTADERVLPGGTAFISDLGSVCSVNSCIGFTKGPIIQRYLTQMPSRFEVDQDPPYVLSGAYIDVDRKTGQAIAIERIKIIDQNAI